jgi:hypothetical protein
MSKLKNCPHPSRMKLLKFFMLSEELSRHSGTIRPPRLFCKAVGGGLTQADCGPEGVTPCLFWGSPYRVSQDEMSIFWEVIVSVILSKKSVYGLFRTVSVIELFHCTAPKLLIRNRYYGLFLLVFTVQVRRLVQFT